MTGQLPDGNLNLDLSALIGRVHQQASIASRSGQYEDLEHIAAELTLWQRRLQRAFALALGEPDNQTGWVTVVNQVAQVRHERDGAQQLHQMAVEAMAEYNRAVVEQFEELDEARSTKADVPPK